MKKKTIALCVLILLVLMVTACGKKNNEIIIDNEYFSATIDTDIFEYSVDDTGMYLLSVVPKISLENGGDTPSHMAVHVILSSQENLDSYNENKSAFMINLGFAGFGDVEMKKSKIGYSDTEFMYTDNYTTYSSEVLRLDDKYVIGTTRTDNFVYGIEGSLALDEFEKSIVIK